MMDKLFSPAFLAVVVGVIAGIAIAIWLARIFARFGPSPPTGPFM
jgi:hypothetical protein